MGALQCQGEDMQGLQPQYLRLSVSPFGDIASSASQAFQGDRNLSLILEGLGAKRSKTTSRTPGFAAGVAAANAASAANIAAAPDQGRVEQAAARQARDRGQSLHNTECGKPRKLFLKYWQQVLFPRVEAAFKEQLRAKIQGGPRFSNLAPMNVEII